MIVFVGLAAPVTPWPALRNSLEWSPEACEMG